MKIPKNKFLNRELLALSCSGLALLTPGAIGQTWQTVDDFRYLGLSSQARAVALDPAGEVYVAGLSAGARTKLIRNSPDAGLTWSDPPLEVAPGSMYNALAADAVGTLYACGNGSPGWLVKRSRDAGLTWSIADLAGGMGPNIPFALAADTAGNVFVCGEMDDGTAPDGVWCVRKGITDPSDGVMSWSTVDLQPQSIAARAVVCHPTAGVFVGGTYTAALSGKNGKTYSQYRWLIRRSVDGGQTWSNSDASQPGLLWGMGTDPAGNLYAVGQNGNMWLVRKSSDGGATWNTVDSWRLNKFAPSVAYAVASDPFGNVFVVGESTYGRAHWIVRMCPAGSATWSTIDDYLLNGNSATPFAVAADQYGNVFVAGRGTRPDLGDGEYDWLVRKLCR